MTYRVKTEIPIAQKRGGKDEERRAINKKSAGLKREL